MKEFEIRERALELMDRLSESFGELSDESAQELEELLEGIENPINYLFYMQEKCRVMAEENKELVEIYTLRRTQWQNKRQRFKARISMLLLIKEQLDGDGKAEGHWGKAWLAKRPKAIVDDLDQIPEDFVQVKVTRSANTQDILKALKGGEDIPGAHLETLQSLTIRSK
tara:strand:+ start:461 stop:967 length:507 start_codon:yes stop_codon:yes gene_type:complete